MDRTLEKYLSFLEGQGKSVKTIRNYTWFLSKISLDMPDYSKESIKAVYDKHISPCRSLATKNLYYSILNSFLEWLKDEAQVINKNPMKGNMIPKPKKPPVIPRNLSDPALREISLKISKLENDTLRLAFTLIMELGLRASEVLTISPKECHITEKGIEVTIHGKGDKIRVLLITPALSSYNLLKESLHKETLFENSWGNNLSYEDLYYHWKDKITQDYTPHQLRHTLASAMLRSGVNIVSIQIFLGHASINSTMRYAHMAANVVNAEIHQFQQEQQMACLR